MANKTILQHVNSILSEMDSRQVVSIGDTDESSEVRDILESVFYEMQAVRPYRKARRYLGLNTYGGSQEIGSKIIYDLNKAAGTYNGQIVELDVVTVPVYKQELPLTEVSRKDLRYMFPEDFIAHTNQRNPTSSTTEIITPDVDIVTSLLIYNNKQPEYYTSFDDRYIVFDSYDADILPDGINQDSVQLRAEVEIDFPTDETDELTQLPRDVIQLLVLKAKQRSFIAMKNMDNSAIAREIRRLERHQSRSQKVIGDEFPMANYGRRGYKNNSNWKFNKNG